MDAFCKLFATLDETNRTGEKVAALERYFAEVPARDGAWALFFLSGQRLRRAMTTTALRAWVGEWSGYPDWLVDECYDTVGDLAETLALLTPETVRGDDAPVQLAPLHLMIEERLLPLRELSPEDARAKVVETWTLLNSQQRFVWNKLITGAFRIGVSRSLVVRALSGVTGVPAATLAHRMMGDFQPTESDYLRVLGRGGEGDVLNDGTSEEGDDLDAFTRPYPFCLAHALEGDVAGLGAPEEWLAEDKWDGIRAQLIRRSGEVLIWSRGEELITDRFPEVAEAARALPDGTVLDGELLAWGGDAPRPFGDLQRRIGRKTVSAKLRAEVPVIFMAYDVLERGGDDVRGRATDARRAVLVEVLRDAGTATAGVMRMSDAWDGLTWEELRETQSSARERGTEGLMLKRRSAAYGTGRVRGDWWKWKVEPMTIDAVLVNAMRGHGRRASLYTDYTFALWNNGELVPAAKAYSGLDDAEIRRVDAFVRKNTTERFGPVRAVKPELVMELAFEGVQRSTRHKCGLAVRFPRIARWRTDKPAAEANTLADLAALLEQVERARPTGASTVTLEQGEMAESDD